MRKLLFTVFCFFLSVSLSAAEMKTIPVSEQFGVDGRYTVMAWVYVPKELGPLDQTGFGVKSYAFFVRGDLMSGVQLYLGLNRGMPEFKFYFPGKGWSGIYREGKRLKAGSGFVEKSELPELSTGEWFHIAGVRDGSSMSVYLNGTKVASRDNAPAAPVVGGPVLQGALRMRPAFWDCRFPGFFEKITIEQRALSSEEIEDIVSRQEVSLPKTLPSLRTEDRPEMDEKLPIVRKWERSHKPQPLGKENCVAKVVMEAGRPRVELNGKIVDATLAIPSPWAKLDLDKVVYRDFSAAGVKFYMDIWFTTSKLNNWWLGEGKYDFEAFDSRLQAMLDGAPDGYYIPRIKLDPPSWWQKENPSEMLAGYVNPASEKWQALFERMLRDVVTHIETSKFAPRVAGYNFGALVGGEWISRRTDVPKEYNPAYWEARAASASVPLLKAARVIKEVTHGNKLTGVFFGYPQAEHANLMQVVTSPDIDFFTSPVSYNGRRAGETGRFSTPYQSTYRAHGKLYWTEADERTHCSEYTGIWHPSWHQQDAFESEGAMMRDLGWSLTSGHEIWWFAIAGSETFHNENLMQVVKRGVELAENRPAKPRISELAVFTPVWYHKDPAEKRSMDMKGVFLNQIMPLCGVPFDSYELADLANPDLPKYKAAIVLTGTHGYMPEPADKNMKLLVFKSENDFPTEPAEVRKWCADMGLHIWTTDGDTFGAGCGFAFIHAASEGDKTITFPDGQTWKGHLKFGETKILRY